MFKYAGVAALGLAVTLTISTIGEWVVAAQPPAQITTLSGNSSPAINTLVKPAAAPQDQVIFMRVIMNLDHRADLESLLADQQNPSSPRYHQWLKRGEFDHRFGPPTAVRTAISDWLKQQGFKVAQSPHDVFAISFRGPVYQAERTFSVSIKSSDAGKHYANINNPSVPSQFAHVIGFIEGLDNLGGGHSTMHVAFGSPNAQAAQVPSNSGKAPRVLESVFYNGQVGFGPSDLYTFYDETPLLNTGINGAGGGCIGLIEIGDYDPQGVVNFDEAFNLPAPGITRVVSPDSDNPGINFRSGETMLDLLYAHAIAPGALLNVYLTDPNASPYMVTS